MQRFQINVTGLYSDDAMPRQISEGVRIDKVPGDSFRRLFPNSERGNPVWPRATIKVGHLATINMESKKMWAIPVVFT